MLALYSTALVRGASWEGDRGLWPPVIPRSFWAPPIYYGLYSITFSLKLFTSIRNYFFVRSHIVSNLICLYFLLRKINRELIERVNELKWHHRKQGNKRENFPFSKHTEYTKFNTANNEAIKVILSRINCLPTLQFLANCKFRLMSNMSKWE